MKIKFQKAAPYAALAVVTLAACGTAAYSRAFVKVKIGPLYVLDFSFVLWFFFACFSTSFKTLRSLVVNLWAPLAFFLWGLAILILRLTPADYGHRALLFPRIEQHALLFIYPLLWMAVGNWLALSDSLFPKIIVSLVLVTSSIANLFAASLVNLSLGPLLIIPCLIVFNESLDLQLPTQKRFLLFGVSTVLAVFTFLPFWQMWAVHLQRTSILLLVLIIIASTCYLGSARPKPLFRLRALLFTGGLLMAGVFVSFRLQRQRQAAVAASEAKPIPLSAKLRHPATGASPAHRPGEAWTETSTAASKPFFYGLWLSLQHGEDAPTAGDSKSFQMRTRRFMWHRALLQAAAHRITGIGFTVEVPDYVEPGYKNTGDFEYIGNPPVSGPHNSYLSILARMGVIGLLLFVVLVGAWVGGVRVLIRRSLTVFDLLLICIPVNGAIYALFNVGFESPHNCMLMWLTMGILLGCNENSFRS